MDKGLLAVIIVFNILFLIAYILRILYWLLFDRDKKFFEYVIWSDTKYYFSAVITKVALIINAAFLICFLTEWIFNKL